MPYIQKQVLPLRRTILEIKGTEKQQAVVMNNLVDVYNLPFTVDNVEELFGNTEEVLGAGWEKYVTMDEHRCYYIETDDQTTPPQRIPNTISDFIEDCHRVWEVNLEWDGNLIKRAFETNYATEA